MKKNIKKLLALLILVIMLVGCATTNETNTTSPNEPTSISSEKESVNGIQKLTDDVVDTNAVKVMTLSDEEFAKMFASKISSSNEQPKEETVTETESQNIETIEEKQEIIIDPIIEVNIQEETKPNFTVKEEIIEFDNTENDMWFAGEEEFVSLPIENEVEEITLDPSINENIIEEIEVIPPTKKKTQEVSLEEIQSLVQQPTKDVSYYFKQVLLWLANTWEILVIIFIVILIILISILFIKNKIKNKPVEEEHDYDGVVVEESKITLGDEDVQRMYGDLNLTDNEKLNILEDVMSMPKEQFQKHKETVEAHSSGKEEKETSKKNEFRNF